MKYYFQLKDLHITLVSLSVLLFNLRYFLRFAFPYRPLRPLWRRVPHVVDTFLLASGVTLAVLTYAVPFWVAQWLGVKLVLLVFYVLFGAFALRSRPRGGEALFNYAMAMACVLLMVLMAYYKPSFWR
ncbi:MAG: SirB2 family protein [Neisseria sp.]|nr:SirB2 family protein [Neisseria sp.]